MGPKLTFPESRYKHLPCEIIVQLKKEYEGVSHKRFSPDTYESLTAEVVEVIKGNYTKKNITLLGDDGNSTNRYIHQSRFKIGSEHLVAVEEDKSVQGLYAGGESAVRIENGSIIGYGNLSYYSNTPRNTKYTLELDKFLALIQEATKRKAAEKLAEGKNKELVAKHSLKVLETSDNLDLRIKALSALYESRTIAAKIPLIPIFKKIINDETENIKLRKRCLYSLGHYDHKDPTIVNFVAKFITHPQFKESAYTGLQLIGSDQAVSELVKALKDNGDDYAKILAVIFYAGNYSSAQTVFENVSLKQIISMDNLTYEQKYAPFSYVDQMFRGKIFNAHSNIAEILFKVKYKDSTSQSQFTALIMDYFAATPHKDTIATLINYFKKYPTRIVLDRSTYRSLLKIANLPEISEKDKVAYIETLNKYIMPIRPFGFE